MTAIERLLRLHDEGVIADGEFVARAVELATSPDEAVTLLRSLPLSLQKQLRDYASSVANDSAVVGFSSGSGLQRVDGTFVDGARFLMAAMKPDATRSLRDTRRDVYSHSVFASPNG